MGHRTEVHNFLMAFFKLILLLISYMERQKDTEGMRQNCSAENSKLFQTATTLPLVPVDAVDFSSL